MGEFHTMEAVSGSKPAVIAAPRFLPMRSL
jgi:hypothetical protein